MLTFRVLEKRITGSFNGKPFNVPRTEDMEKSLQDIQNGDAEAPSAEEWDGFLKNARKTVVAGSNEHLSFNPVTDEYYLTVDGTPLKNPIPETLVKYIEESFEKGIDFTPLLKAWARFLINPRYTKENGKWFDKYLNTVYIDRKAAEVLMEEEDLSMEAALAACTYNDLSITKEGLLATYKVAEIVTWEWKMVEEDGEWVKVKEDKYKTTPAVLDSVTGEVVTPAKMEKPEFAEDFVFTPAICKSGDKFYSGKDLGYVYKVGEMQHLPAGAKRNLDNTFGGGGLYIGGLNYIEGYRSSGTHVLCVFANPTDILSFQDSGCAMRVDALFPNAILEGEDDSIKQKNIYHSSDYGKLSEERFSEMLRQALKNEKTILEMNEAANLGEEIEE